MGFSAAGLVAGASTMGVETAAFSFPEASKLSFLTGESLILRFSSEVAAYSKGL
jgi:hypothetical protein